MVGLAIPEFHNHRPHISPLQLLYDKVYSTFSICGHKYYIVLIEPIFASIGSLYPWESQLI